MSRGAQTQVMNRTVWRRLLLLTVMLFAFAGLVWRAVDLRLNHQEFLQSQGEARYLRVVKVPAHRGKVLDRNGYPLAISTPVDSVWVSPREFRPDDIEFKALVKLLGLDPVQLQRMLEARRERGFEFLKRHVDPAVANSVMALGIEGVYLQREYRRYYPMGEIAAHVVGFTNIDDVGQEGIELAFENALRGIGGSKRVLRDRIGRVVADVDQIREPKSGRDLVLSIDRRIQYHAYRALLTAVNRNQARAGSIVVLDAQNGEVLAMVNQPSYNPNNRAERVGSRFRNRAVTDVFEPGSAVKPFTIAAALNSGQFKPDTVVDTSPGSMKVGKYTIKDVRNYGRIDLATIVKKSSNVGASKVALSLPPRDIWQTLSRFGFGLSTGSGFPGEAEGVLTHYFEWREAHRATLSYGYGLSVTVLQLAQAYAAIANGGTLLNARFLPAEAELDGTRVVSEDVALKLRRMLEAAASPSGTGSLARFEGFRVAGKTGTVRKATPGGYSEDRYIALFAGMAPISSPRIVTVVVIDEPSAGEYYAGKVAAPVFAEVTEGALRLLGVAPDDRGLPARRMVTAGAAVSRDQSANTDLTRVALRKDRRGPEATQ